VRIFVEKEGIMKAESALKMAEKNIRMIQKFLKETRY
jgi:hypothetical protein